MMGFNTFAEAMSKRCSAANGGIIETPKTEKHKARAIIQINYGN